MIRFTFDNEIRSEQIFGVRSLVKSKICDERYLDYSRDRNFQSKDLTD